MWVAHHSGCAMSATPRFEDAADGERLPGTYVTKQNETLIVYVQNVIDF